MALTNTDRKVIHAGNGSATVFPYGFPILSDAHLSVIFTDAAGGETTLSPSLYATTGIGSLTGGSITYPLDAAPIPAGTRLTIVRTVPYTQTTVLSNQGGYYPEVVERRFDEIYMAIQQLAEIVGRTSTFSISDPTTQQSNYALIQSLQTFRVGIDKLTTQGDLLTRDASNYKRLARGTAGQFLGVSGADVAWATPTVDLSTSQATGVLPRSKGGFDADEITNALGANVNMTAIGTYYTAPTIAQGTSGTWFVSGSVTVINTGGGDNVNVKLWDGSNVIASTSVALVSISGTYRANVHLSGIAVSPAGNLRISVSPVSRTDGAIAFNQSGNSKDSTISAIRIA